MKADPSRNERLLRYLDGRLSPAEDRQIRDWLRTEPAARAFLREVAEQAAMVADLERIAAGRQGTFVPRPLPTAGTDRQSVPVRFRAWPWVLAAAATVAILAVAVYRWLPHSGPDAIRVTKVTGSSEYFGARGRIENALAAGTPLRAGDALETRSCDAWIDLRLLDGSTLTIAGHSSLRVLEGTRGLTRLRLSQGSLWVKPSTNTPAQPLWIQTPALEAVVEGGQFDLQTSATESIVRVNAGTAQVRKARDGGPVTVAKDQQVSTSLGRKDPLVATAQPAPTNRWACDLGRVPEVILGRWLPPTVEDRARLGAEPLLWPISDRDSVMLYAAALAAWKSSEHPVVLHADSTLRFRGRTTRTQTVRFGFSAQKIRGVFAGKFEVDVSPDSLQPAGETWEVEIPLTNFQPLHPQLAASPEGLELTDVYALTIREDAGLELNHIELGPAPIKRTEKRAVLVGSF